MAIAAETQKVEESPFKIEVSTEAQGQLKEILKGQRPGLSVRVFVQLGGGGGCCGGGGAQFGMALDTPKNGDKTYSVDGISLLVDPYSLEYLNGANIQYVKEGEESGFKIDSPNMPKSVEGGDSCGSGGCGSGGCGCG